MTIRSLADADAALVPYVHRPRPNQTTDYRLDETQALLELAGRPHERLRIVHIAGTSGKTSTAYYMAALLHAGAQKTGLTISPHVDGVNERVQIDGQPLTPAEFGRELGEFLDMVEAAGQSPSYFELLFVFALWVFVRRGVKYAVVETGVGGLLDATNAASRPDKVCVITDIGFDHMNVLGDTLPEIAAQKIGIAHEGNPVFMYRQDEAIMRVVRAWTADHGAELNELEQTALEKTNAPLALFGYQRRNWLLADRAYRYLEKRDKLQYLTRQVLRETQTITIPGRLETRQIDGKTIVMDGAHNKQKMLACLDGFRKLYPDVKPAMLLSLKEGKEYEELAPLLAPFASKIIVTSFDTTQDSQAISMDTQALAEALKQADAANVSIEPDLHDAWQALLAAPEKAALVTGSFYLLSQLRNNELV